MSSQNSDNDNFNKKRINKRNVKKRNSKDFIVDICEEIEFYEIDEKTRKYYEGFDHFSHKEKLNFENKFSKPLNKSQEKYLHLLQNYSQKIVTAIGPSGTGKTTLATELGIKLFLLGKYQKLIFVRPTVSVDDEQLGFLPGCIEEKMAPWIRPIYDILYQFISPKEVQYMIENKEIEIAPLAFMRGRTFKNSWIVADEMQNSTISQMKMLLTRIGHNTKLVITGDLDQHDRIGKNEINGLEDFTNKLRRKRSSSISSVEFTHNDIEREDVVKEILELYNDDDVEKSNYLQGYSVELSSSPPYVNSIYLENKKANNEK